MSERGSLTPSLRQYMRDRAQKFRDECRRGSAAWLLAGDVLVLLREIEGMAIKPDPEPRLPELAIEDGYDL